MRDVTACGHSPELPPDPFRTGGVDEEIVGAQRHLNQLSGSERLRVTGHWDGETARELARFQESMGHKPTGRPDPSTLAALEREAARVVSGRAVAPDVDAALRAFDEAMAPSQRMHEILEGARSPTASERPSLASNASMDALQQEAASSLERTSELEALAARHRRRHGIPLARTTRHGRRVDGWVARSDGYARRIGLLANQELLVTTCLEGLVDNPDAARAAATGIESAHRMYGRVDQALVFSVAARESRGHVFSRTRGRINIFRGGGLDYLAGAMKDRTLFSAGEVRAWSTGTGDGLTEGRRTIDTVRLPRTDQVRAYAGAVENAWRRFESAVGEQVGEDRAAQMLGDLSDDARRMWIQIAFGGPGGSRYVGEGHTYGRSFGLTTVLGRVSARAEGTLDLESVLDADPFLDQFHRFMRARVTSAEAALFEHATAGAQSTRHGGGVQP